MKLIIWACILCVAFGKKRHYPFGHEKSSSSSQKDFTGFHYPLNPSLNIPYGLWNENFPPVYHPPGKTMTNYPWNSEGEATPYPWVLSSKDAAANQDTNNVHSDTAPTVPEALAAGAPLVAAAASAPGAPGIPPIPGSPLAPGAIPPPPPPPAPPASPAALPAPEAPLPAPAGGSGGPVAPPSSGGPGTLIVPVAVPAAPAVPAPFPPLPPAPARMYPYMAYSNIVTAPSAQSVGAPAVPAPAALAAPESSAVKPGEFQASVAEPIAHQPSGGKPASDQAAGGKSASGSLSLGQTVLGNVGASKAEAAKPIAISFLSTKPEDEPNEANLASEPIPLIPEPPSLGQIRKLSGREYICFANDYIARKCQMADEKAYQENEEKKASQPKVWHVDCLVAATHYHKVGG
ncbi:PREDICTED: proline-rich protein 27 [Dipodomys ordii]|uniref:Proline-rich protein 27 n=1 Tax=Dipodomys ordii TaxID=10020 RepID=A0A1S3FGA7_DIPOR|nr:PREDICTED: proline-rich protein 27 [Dipodomys ordii]